MGGWEGGGYIGPWVYQEDSLTESFYAETISDHGLIV